MVSIVIPMMNEAHNIAAALSAVVANRYPRERMEVIVVDGGSTDDTLSVVRSFSDKLRLKVIVEQGCTVYRALNIALAASVGDVFVRVDARSVIPTNYISACLKNLSQAGVKCVGGVQEQYGVNPTGEAIAIATGHPLGVGGAAFRLGKQSGYVDTVYLGCYPKSVFQEIGQYDDDGRVVSEDSMFNKRLRDQGGKIFLDHTLRVKYPAKSSLAALVRQYFTYGGAKAHVWLKYRALTSSRQIIPIFFLLATVITALAGVWWPPALLLLAAVLLPYAVLVISVSFHVLHKRRRLDLLGRLILAFIAIHFAWPIGFIMRAASPTLYFRFLPAPKATK